MILGPLELLILQPTRFCNIDCAYCYLEDRADRTKMSREVLRAALRRAFTSGIMAPRMNITWHAGEPLAVGKDLYRLAAQVIAEERPADKIVTQTVQTNATLIDDEWCELFKAHDFTVGVSLDGPQDIHDAFRKTRAGGGTFATAMNGIERLRQHGLKPPAIAVVTRAYAGQEERILDFFEAEGFTEIAFNIEEPEGNAPRWSFSNCAEAEATYATFMARAHERHKRGAMKIREFDQIERALANHGPRKLAAIPLRWVTVGVEGEFSTYCPQLHNIRYQDGRRHCFGNVLTDELIDVFANPDFLSVQADVIEGGAKCALTCSRFHICGAYQMAGRYFEHGTFNATDSLFCRAKIMSIAEMVERARRRAA